MSGRDVGYARARLAPAGSGRIPLRIHSLLEAAIPADPDRLDYFFQRFRPTFRDLLESARVVKNGKGAPLYPVWVLTSKDTEVHRALERMYLDRGRDALVQVAVYEVLLDMGLAPKVRDDWRALAERRRVA